MSEWFSPHLRDLVKHEQDILKLIDELSGIWEFIRAEMRKEGEKLGLEYREETEESFFSKIEWASLRINFPEMNIEELSAILDTTIKEDVVTKNILFLGMLMNYTKDDQHNFGFSGPSSSGKTYITTQELDYFPAEDIEKHHYTSPQAFFYRQDAELINDETQQPLQSKSAHVQENINRWLKDNPKPDERGKITEWRDQYKEEQARIKEEWDTIPKKQVIDLRGKIIAFLDQPSYQLMERLRPVLSHDEKDATYETQIASTSSSGETKTIKIILRGHPTFVFLSVRMAADEQEQNRMFLLSTDVSTEKLHAALNVLQDRLSDKGQYAFKIEDNDNRVALKERVQAIKELCVSDILIREKDMQWFTDKFRDDFETLTPRGLRDYPRAVIIAKAHALLNAWHRETQIKKGLDGKTALEIFAERQDLEAGYELFRPIAIANARGMSPLLWQFWSEMLEPNLDETGLCYQEIRDLYRKLTGSNLSKQMMTDTITILIEAGLVDKQRDADDKRRMRIIRKDAIPNLKKNSSNSVQVWLDDLPNTKFTMSQKEYDAFGSEALRLGLIEKINSSEYHKTGGISDK